MLIPLVSRANVEHQRKAIQAFLKPTTCYVLVLSWHFFISSSALGKWPRVSVASPPPRSSVLRGWGMWMVRQRWWNIDRTEMLSPWELVYDQCVRTQNGTWKRHAPLPPFPPKKVGINTKKKQLILESAHLHRKVLLFLAFATALIWSHSAETILICT